MTFCPSCASTPLSNLIHFCSASRQKDLAKALFRSLVQVSKLTEPQTISIFVMTCDQVHNFHLLKIVRQNIKSLGLHSWTVSNFIWLGQLLCSNEGPELGWVTSGGNNWCRGPEDLSWPDTVSLHVSRGSGGSLLHSHWYCHHTGLKLHSSKRK